jgi:arabinogalactan endo-1,4-beta-galactosidase
MWHKDIKTLGRNLSVLAQHEPDKQVMIVETAFYYSHKNDKWNPTPLITPTSIPYRQKDSGSLLTN